ncbi:MAG TPA: hypothetical protein VEU08_12655 [Vicinamibacterales bacterium]|nr:hypothetical protein [Vicinamibacterales bacterium]
MRDVVAGLVAGFLILAALSLATALQVYRRKRQRARDSERALGRSIVAEIPAASDLVLFSQDDKRFYFGESSIDKDLVVAVRVLINGSPIAAYVSRRHAREEHQATTLQDREEGIARDRWDVAIETISDTVLVPCGAIRERVSQELARAVFDAVKGEVERIDRSVPGPLPPGGVTTPSRERSRGD